MAFATERTIKAVRKARKCCACSRIIEVGSPAVDWSGTSDGDFHAVSYHVECRDAEIALNRLHETQHDEWIGLDDLEWEDWQYLLDEHPVVAQRLKITQRKIDVTVKEMAECSARWAEIARAKDAERQAALVAASQPGTERSGVDQETILPQTEKGS